jgi:hypothetical protein
MDKWGVQKAGSYDYLKTIIQPTLAVNGSNDLIMPTVNSFIMEQNIPNSQLVIYPDSTTGRSSNIPNFSSGMSRCSWRNRVAVRKRCAGRQLQEAKYVRTDKYSDEDDQDPRT